MADELDLLKKDWQRREAGLPKLSYDEIYAMIWKRSFSLVKWIFYISILEFVFWAGINIFFNDPQSARELEAMHIDKMILALNIVNYGVILYFIYRFYVNYRKISFTDSSRKLMKTILRVKRTVTQYVWYNLIIFAASAAIYLYGMLLYTPEGTKIVETASKEVNPFTFWALVIVVSVLFTGFVLLLIWLFYKLLYGILLNRLRENYKELKKLEF